MAYIGRGTENISNVEVLDNLTFNGSASYTLQKSSVNFVPSSANNLLISISGVVQQGNFSVSGSTITFDTTVSGSDTCDWILHYGTGLITTVADGTITEAKLGSNAVTTAKINNGAITSAKLDSGLALGKIGQVLTTHVASAVTTTSTTFTAHTNVSVNITPTSTSSKILVFISTNLDAQNTGYTGYYTIYRDSTNLNVNTQTRGFTQIFSNSGRVIAPTHVSVLDSPATTSQITYGGYFRVSNSAGTVGVGGDADSVITVMEVLA